VEALVASFHSPALSKQIQRLDRVQRVLAHSDVHTYGSKVRAWASGGGPGESGSGGSGRGGGIGRGGGGGGSADGSAAAQQLHLQRSSALAVGLDSWTTATAGTVADITEEDMKDMVSNRLPIAVRSLRHRCAITACRHTSVGVCVIWSALPLQVCTATRALAIALMDNHSIVNVELETNYLGVLAAEELREVPTQRKAAGAPLQSMRVDSTLPEALFNALWVTPTGGKKGKTGKKGGKKKK
jgi:hypothetical protein